MKSVSIRTRFFASLALMLALVCGIGFFAWVQSSSLARLNRFSSTVVVPGLEVSGHLARAISNVRIAQAEYLNQQDAAQRNETASVIADAKTTVPAQLRVLMQADLPGPWDDRLLADLQQRMTRYFHDTDQFMEMLDRAT